MANPRIQYTIGAEVDGVQQIEAFSDELKELARVADAETAAAARGLQQELDNLADKGRAVQHFLELERTAKEVAQELRNAEKAHKQFSDEVRGSGAVTREQTLQLQLQEKVLEGLSDELQKHQAAAQQAGQELNKFGIATDQAKTAQKGMGDELRRIRKAAQDTIPAYRNAANAAKASGAAIDEAFGVVGVRGANEIEREIKEVRDAMRLLQNSASVTGRQLSSAMSAGNDKIKRLERDLREARGEMTLMDRASKTLKTSVGSITAGNVAANAIGFLATKVAEAGREFIRANVELQNLRRAFNTIYGDAGLAAKQIDFLRKVSHEAGVEFSAITEDFKTFSASSTKAGLSLQVTNDLFESVTKASSTLGLSSQRTGLILQALAQMASKGKVSMEELRQQLGESLPGALSLTAQGLGVTEQELNKLVETGQLTAQDVFPALAVSLRSMHGDTNSLTNAWARMKNALTSAAQSAGDGGGLSVLVGGLKLLTVVLGTVVTIAHGFAEVLGLVGKAIGMTVANIGIFLSSSLSFGEKISLIKDNMSDFNNEIVASGERLGNTYEAFKTAVTGMDSMTTAVSEQTQAQAELNKQWQAAGAQASALIETQKQGIINSQKYAEAKKIEGASLVEIAKLRGNDLEVMRAQITAAEDERTAIAQVVTAKQAVITAMQEELKSKEEIVESNEELKAARGKELDEMRVAIDAKRAEIEVDKEKAAALDKKVGKMQLEAQQYQDNAARVSELKMAYEQAAAALEQVKAARDKGQASSEQVRAATERAARAEVLYKDALNDSIRNIKAKQAAKQAEVSLLQAGFATQQKALELALMQARRDGDASKVKKLLIKQKRIEIAQTKLKVKVLRMEAAATIASIKADRARLELKGALTKSQKLEFDTALANAKIKQEQAKAQEIGIQMMQEEIRAIEKGVDARGRAAGSSQSYTQSIRQETAAVQENTKALNANFSEQVKRDEQARRENRLKGQGGAVDNTTHYNLLHKLNSGTIDAGDLAAAQGTLKAALFNQQMMQENATAYSALAIQDINAQVQEARRMVDAARTKAGQSGQVKQVRVQLDLNKNKLGSVNTDDAGAATIQQFMEKLKSEKERAYG